jgi:uncharacterized membrane protein YphA (DoxX/SURF4 family)
MSHFFSPSKGIWYQPGISLVRIVTGLFLVYHGVEVFNPKLMNDYAKWLTDLHFPSPLVMAYIGKSTELIAGCCITIGLFTRLMIWPMIFLMLTICFGMGKGRIFYEDQHPFLFVLIGLIFFFIGPGKFSADQYLFGKK